MFYIKKKKLIKELIIYFVLFIITSQKNSTDLLLEQNDLSFCFPINNITNNTKEIEILCYDEICYGILYKKQINSFINITVICNNSSCNIKNDKSKEKCKYCTEMILTCFRNKCIGGPINNILYIDGGSIIFQLQWFIIIPILWVILIIFDIILIKCLKLSDNCRCLNNIYVVIFFAPFIFTFFIVYFIKCIIISIFYCECLFSKPTFKIEYKKDKEKKETIIQRHSHFSDIKEIDNDLYLVNNEEVRITLMLYHSLKIVSRSISVYTFNKGQVELLEEAFKNELSFVKIILLNETCTNFNYSDYIIINYIQSPISQESKEKYPTFYSNLNSKNILQKILPIKF